MHYTRRFCLGLFVTGFVVTLASQASARSFRVNDIPNGGQYQCLSCHGSNSGHSYTPFGNDADTHLSGSGSTSSKHENWTTLCPLDSDGDGFTNGQELGDPNCTWTRGSANPAGPTSNPGDPNSKPAAPPPTCGNGALDSGEQCDGTLMTASTCAAAGDGTGTLSCRSNCTFDTSQCSQPVQSTSAGSGSPSSSSPSSGTGATQPSSSGNGNGNGNGDGGAGGSDAFGDNANSDNTVPPILPGACSVQVDAVSSQAGTMSLISMVVGLVWVLRRSAKN